MSEQIKQAVRENHQALLTTDNVVGVARGMRVTRGKVLDEEVLSVLVAEKKPETALKASQLIPAQIQGIQTDVIQVGHIRAMSYTDRVRPLVGGYSIGHYKVTAGTLGAFVKNGTSGRRYILSNNHVIANSNDAKIGDTIIQPGSADGGRPSQDAVAKLHAFCPIDFGEAPGDCDLAGLYVFLGNMLARLFRSSHRVSSIKKRAATNLIDAALAIPDDGIEIDDKIVVIGKVTDIEKAFLGMQVEKSGRTTGFTKGSIQFVDATVTVDYGGGQSAIFTDQLISGFMSRGGDSGSLLVSSDTKKAVGLLFAGSDQVTIYNQIAFVLDYFGVNF